MQDKADIFGVEIDNLTAADLSRRIIELAQAKARSTVLYANANSMRLAKKSRDFQRILNSAGILHPDGYAVVWASRMAGCPLKEKIVTTDFFADLCPVLAEMKLRVYLLGAKPQVVLKTKENLLRIAPNLDICGFEHGYFSGEDDLAVIGRINRSRPDILVVGMGSPRQETWIINNRHLLDVPLCWAVGGLFDILSGAKKRAPLWMRNCHLEWLFRLLLEPGRLWKRYLVVNPLFVYQVLIFKFRKSKYK